MKSVVFRLVHVFALLFICLVFSFELNANTGTPKFYNVNELYGISARHANSVCKDENGFIWTATKSGIIRLTADEYRIYQLPFESQSIVTLKLAYSKGILWAYSNDGQIFQYDQIFDKFNLKFNLGKVFNNRHLSVTSVLFENKDTCWMATSDGLILCEVEAAQVRKFSAGTVLQLEWRDSETFFAVSLNDIAVFNTSTFKKDVLFRDLFSYYFLTFSVCCDSSHKRLWLGSNFNGLFYLDLNSLEVRQFKPGYFPMQPVMDIETVDSRTLLVGVDGQGVWKIDQETMEVVDVYKDDADNPTAISGNGVYDIFHDTATNKVWVCTYSGGLSYFNLGSSLVEHVVHQVNQANSLINNNVNCVIEDSENNMWFATDNGISYWKVNEGEWQHFYENNREQAQVFLTICEDKNGHIWAGSYASGVYVLNPKTGEQIAHYSKTVDGSPFINDFVFSIYEDTFGDIWIGGVNSEVVRYIPDENNFRKYAFQPVTKVIEYTDSLMLLACSYGLLQLNKYTGVYNLLVEKYLVNDVLVHNGQIWLGTVGYGLILFDPATKELKNFTVEDGLLSNHVNSIIYADGHFWLGTENGLCRFSPESANVIAYSNHLPLIASSFNANSHFLLHDGRLAMGTNNGLVLFRPSQMAQKQLNGRIYFQNISVLGRSVRDIPSFKLCKPVDQLENLRLKYSQNSITVELMPVGEVAKAMFSWKLEGIDPDWTQPSNHRLVSYNNIPYKKYELKIRMYDSSLSQLIAERVLQIKVLPPFWAKWWFFAIVFLLLSVLIYAMFWYYIYRLKQQHIEDKVRFFTNTAHDIRTSLTLIKAPVEALRDEKNLSERGRQFIEMANEQAQRLNATVTQLMDFQKADIRKEKVFLTMVNLPEIISQRIGMFSSLAATKNIQIKNNFKTKHYESAVDIIQIEKVIDNLVSNAIKYSNEKSLVEISFSGNDKQWVLTVKDHGIGVSKRDQKLLFKEFFRAENAINSKIVGSGVGLLLVKNIIKLHDGEITFTSEENLGSIFTVIVPHKQIANTNDNDAISLLANPEVFDDNDQAESDEDFDNVLTENNNKAQKILIVEDNDDLMHFLRLSFVDEFDVSSASNGVEAWEKIQNELPDLIISDVMMPKMGGFELCKLVKSTFETSHVPVVLLTAFDDKAMQLRGLGFGADDYLTKPFDMGLLHQKIRSIIQNRTAVREKALRLIQTDQNAPVLNNSLNDEFLHTMLSVVKQNIDNPEFNKDDFARAMKVSGSLLYKKVKALTDLSPVDFIKSVRMGYALELLQKGGYSVAEVSDKCGYTSAGYFSTVFKKYYGKAPSEV